MYKNLFAGLNKLSINKIKDSVIDIINTINYTYSIEICNCKCGYAFPKIFIYKYNVRQGKFTIARFSCQY